MTTEKTDATADLETVTQRVRELSDQVIAQAKDNGQVWLEGYERVLRNLLDLEEQAAKETGVDWVGTLASTHANLVRETSQVFLGAFRERPAASGS